MGKSGKFLVGALVGAAAAALLTPLPGKKARKKVAERLEQAGVNREKLGEVAAAAVAKGSELLLAARKKSGRTTKTKSS